MHPTSNNLFFRNNGGLNVFGIQNQTAHAYQTLNVHNPITGSGAPYTKAEVDTLLADKEDNLLLMADELQRVLHNDGVHYP